VSPKTLGGAGRSSPGSLIILSLNPRKGINARYWSMKKSSSIWTNKK